MGARRVRSLPVSSCDTVQADSDTPSTIYVARRDVKQDRSRPGVVAHFHADDGQCLTPAEVRANSEMHFTDVITISDALPFECRDRRSHDALVSERLVDLFDFDDADELAQWSAESVEEPRPAPPPLSGAATSTAPPRQPVASCRVKEVVTI